MRNANGVIVYKFYIVQPADKGQFDPLKERGFVSVVLSIPRLTTGVSFAGSQHEWKKILVWQTKALREREDEETTVTSVTLH
jgi:hypothetical protein